MTTAPRGRSGGYGRYGGKRVFDLLVLAAAAVPASLFGLLCAAAVRLTSPGPILFRQERVGRNGERFVLLKFRSMVDANDNPAFPHPDRITRAGRWLRRYSLDEIPQLINVARGEMSIVGPRPTLAYQVARYDERQKGRLTVNPGITGLAQVRGRNEIAWAQRIEWDLEYIARQSPSLDLAILWETARQLLAGRGVEGHPTDDPIAAIDDSRPGDDVGTRRA
jgi:sugar transferase EpsL